MVYGLRDRDGVCELRNSFFAQARVAFYEIRATFTGWIRDISWRVKEETEMDVSGMKMITYQRLTLSAP